MKAVYIVLIVVAALCALSTLITIIVRVSMASRVHTKPAPSTKPRPPAAIPKPSTGPSKPTTSGNSGSTGTDYKKERDRLLDVLKDAINDVATACPVADQAFVHSRLFTARNALFLVTDMASLEMEKKSTVDSALALYQSCKSSASSSSTLTQVSPQQELGNLIQWCKTNKTSIPFLADIETKLVNMRDSTTYIVTQEVFKYAKEVKEFVDEKMVKYSTSEFLQEVDQAIEKAKPDVSKDINFKHFVERMQELIARYRSKSSNIPAFYMQLWLEWGLYALNDINEGWSIFRYDVAHHLNRSLSKYYRLVSNTTVDCRAVRDVMYEAGIIFAPYHVYECFYLWSKYHHEIYEYSADMVAFGLERECSVDDLKLLLTSSAALDDTFSTRLNANLQTLTDTDMNLYRKVCNLFETADYMVTGLIEVACHALSKLNLEAYDATIELYLKKLSRPRLQTIRDVLARLLKAKEYSRFEQLFKALDSNSENVKMMLFRMIDEYSSDNAVDYLSRFLDAYPDLFKDKTLLHVYIALLAKYDRFDILQKVTTSLDTNPVVTDQFRLEVVNHAFAKGARFQSIPFLRIVVDYARIHGIAVPQTALDLLAAPSPPPATTTPTVTTDLAYEAERDDLMAKLDLAIADTRFTCTVHDKTTVRNKLVEARNALNSVHDSVSLRKERALRIDNALRQYNECKVSSQALPSSNPVDAAALDDLISWCKDKMTQVPFLSEIHADLVALRNRSLNNKTDGVFEYAQKVKQFVDKKILEYESSEFADNVDKAIRDAEEPAKISVQIRTLMNTLINMKESLRLLTLHVPKFYHQLWMEMTAACIQELFNYHRSGVDNGTYALVEFYKRFADLIDSAPYECSAVREMFFQGAIRTHNYQAATSLASKLNAGYNGFYEFAADVMVYGMRDGYSEDDMRFLLSSYIQTSSAFRNRFQANMQDIIENDSAYFKQVCELYTKLKYEFSESMKLATYALDHSCFESYDALFEHMKVFSSQKAYDYADEALIKLIKLEDLKRCNELFYLALAKGADATNLVAFIIVTLHEDHSIDDVDRFLQAIKDGQLNFKILLGYGEAMAPFNNTDLWTTLLKYIDPAKVLSKSDLERLLTAVMTEVAKESSFVLFQELKRYAVAQGIAVPQALLDNAAKQTSLTGV